MVTEPAEGALPDWRISWLDRLHVILARLPLPWWLPILLVPVSLIALELIIRQVSNSQPPDDAPALGLMIFYATQPWYVIALLYFLDRRAEQAVIALEPLLRNGTDSGELRFTIGNMPYWPALLWTAIGLALFLLAHFFTTISENLVLAGSPESVRGIRLVEGALVWMAGLVAFYHTVRQLRIIDDTFTRRVRTNLLDQVPLYGLAGVSAYTAVGLAIPSTVVLLALPQVPTDVITLAIVVSVFGLAVLTFVAPLYRVHLELASEKADRLSANAVEMDALIQQVHKQAKARSFEGVGEMHTAIQILNLERTLIDSARTWPWPPGSIRALLATLLLPILIWIIQRLLAAFLP